jgi:hypothetical protein
VLAGTVMRKVLCSLIKHRAFVSRAGVDGTSAKKSQQQQQQQHPLVSPPLVSWRALECVYPRYPEVHQLVLSETDR